MQSRASFFIATVYRRNLTRFAPLWILYFVLWLVIMPLSVLSQGNSPYFNLGDLQRTVLYAALRYGNLINLVYAALIAMALYSWYFHPKSVNAMAALPIRREAFFLTNLLTALTVSLVPNLLIALLSWGAASMTGLPGCSAAAQWLGIVLLQVLFDYGAASLCAAIAGQLLALPALYLLLNFAAVVLNSVTVAVLSTFVYGMQGGGYTLPARFSPAFYMAARMDLVEKTAEAGGETVYYCVFHGWSYLFWIAAAGVVLLAAAFLLFRRRRMEAAGDVIAVRPLRPVLKYCFTAGCSLVLGVLAATTFFSGSNGPQLPAMVLCLLAGGFVGYFTSEILLKKTFHVFRREWIGFGAFSLCLLAAVGLMEFDVFGFERRVPDVSEVESITLGGSSFWENAIVTDEAYLADLITLHQSIISGKQQQEALARRWPDDREDLDYTVVDLIYQLKNGKTLSRSYALYCTEEMWLDASSLPRQYADIIRDPYIITLVNVPNFDVSPASVDYSYLNVYDAETLSYQTEDLTSEEAYTLYTDCILPDLQEGLIGYSAPYYFEDTSETRYMADIYIGFSHILEDTPRAGQGRVTLGSAYLDVIPTVGSRTADYLEELGYHLILCSEAERLEASYQQ